MDEYYTIKNNNNCIINYDSGCRTILNKEEIEKTKTSILVI